MGEILVHKHLIVRAEVRKPVESIESLKAWALEMIDAVNMKLAVIPDCTNPIAWDCKIPGNVGKTLVAVIETSNIGYHDWETDYGALVEFDLYSCGEFTPDQVVQMFERFDPIKLEYKFLDREHSLTLVDEA